MSKPAERDAGEQGCSSWQQELLGDSPGVHPQELTRSYESADTVLLHSDHSNGNTKASN